jgi:hypothetical protein
MTRSPWKRAFTALLVVMACTWAVPAKASTAAPTMDSTYSSAMKLWTKAMEWLTDLWTAPSSVQRGHNLKFGAGHSSDGHGVAKASAKPMF